MGSWVIHLLICIHNGVAVVFTQFTDDQGLFNMEVADDIASKGVQGATENDGILLVMGFVGMITLYLYISVRILFKVLGLRNKTESQIKEDEEEFYSTSKRRSSFGGRPRMDTADRALNARTSSWDKSKAGGGMLAHILGVQGAESQDGEDGDKEQELMINPMKSKSKGKSNGNAAESTTKKNTTEPEPKKEHTKTLKSPAKKDPVEQLPDGWSEAVDPTSGKTYYPQQEDNEDPVDTSRWEQ